MEQKINKSRMLLQFEQELKANEKSAATIAKYCQDILRFMEYARDGSEITKEMVIAYKQNLSETYAVTSANSKLASVNCFLRVIGRADCVVKTFKVQRTAFRAKECELSKKEYIRLLKAAEKKGNTCLCLIMQTICATGIRISELPFITVESLAVRRASVSSKGKTRTVILPVELCRKLEAYVEKRGVAAGSIFVTRNGKPLDRSNIYHGMKALCGDAGVEKSKVFPHNLRHLFALTYYEAERDICHLADLLGHANINTTRIYTIVSCEEQEQRIDGLDLLLDKKQITT